MCVVAKRRNCGWSARICVFVCVVVYMILPAWAWALTAVGTVKRTQKANWSDCVSFPLCRGESITLHSTSTHMAASYGPFIYTYLYILPTYVDTYVYLEWCSGWDIKSAGNSHRAHTHTHTIHREHTAHTTNMNRHTRLYGHIICLLYVGLFEKTRVCDRFIGNVRVCIHFSHFPCRLPHFRGKLWSRCKCVCVCGVWCHYNSMCTITRISGSILYIYMRVLCPWPRACVCV